MTRLATCSLLGLCLTLLTLPALAQTPGRTLPEAKDLFEGHIEAIGGRDAIAAITSRRFSGSAEIRQRGPGGQETVTKAIVTLTARHPDKLRQEIFAPGRFDQTIIFDGERGWQLLNGQAVAIEGSQLRSVRETADFNTYYGLGYEERYTKIETRQWITLRGETLALVRATRPNGQTDLLFFDPDTSLLRAFRPEPADQDDGIPPAETWIEDFEEYQGVRVPIRLTVFGADYQSVIEYQTVEINIKTTDEFEPPAGASGG